MRASSSASDASLEARSKTPRGRPDLLGEIADAGRVHDLAPVPEILEQDRAQLDDAQRGLAPSDDGVHAGTVAVVGTDPAVAVAVERGGVAAVAAITFTGDQVDEGRFLSLLHDSLTSHTDGHAGRGTGDGIGNSGDDAGWEWPEV